MKFVHHDEPNVLLEFNTNQWVLSYTAITVILIRSDISCSLMEAAERSSIV